MANRSYLYSFNKDADGKISKIFDISEQNYEIPIIYKILVSANTKIVPSEIYENSLALVGDAKQGRKNLDSFFKKLHKAAVFETKELTNLQEMFIEHLNKYTLDYFLFEPVEVLLMDGEKTDKEVKAIAKEIANYNEMVNDFINYTCDDCWSELGIDFSNYLYFSLGDEKEVEKIEKQYSNKKLRKAKELIVKKPSIEHYFTLINELDKETDTEEINSALDNILTLKPNFEQLWDCAYYYKDLDKKIALFKQLIIDYPKKSNNCYYELADLLAEKKDYNLALKYAILYLKNNKDSVQYITQLEDIIEDGNFNALKEYQNISKTIKIKEIEKNIIKINIENGDFQKALDNYYQNNSLFSDGDWEIILKTCTMKQRINYMKFKKINKQ